MNPEHFRRLCEILFTSKFVFVSSSKPTADTAVAVLQYCSIFQFLGSGFCRLALSGNKSVGKPVLKTIALAKRKRRLRHLRFPLVLCTGLHMDLFYGGEIRQFDPDCRKSLA